MSRSAVFLLLAFSALIPYAALQARFSARLRSAPGRLGSAPGREAAWRRYAARRSLASVAGAAFWVFGALAASGAVGLTRYVSETVVGAEIAFVIDASNSMLTDDGRGTRLELAKDFTARLAASADGAGLSIVAFRGRPTTLCPSTLDRRAFSEALRWAGPTVTSAAGTDVGAAIDEAARPALLAGTARVIVVLSDGNDTGGAARAASARAASAGITLAFVGLGGDTARPVLDPQGTPVRAAGGSVRETALNHASLRDWAAAGRGSYVSIAEPDAFSRVAAVCQGAAASTGRRRDVRVEVDASPVLALAALAALGLALALSAPPMAPSGDPRGSRAARLGASPRYRLSPPGLRRGERSRKGTLDA